MDSRGLISMDSAFGRLDVHANVKRGLHPNVLARIARIYVCTLVGLVIPLFARGFFVENLQILLPTFAAIVIYLVFALRLRSQIHDNIFGEIGFVYLTFAVAYTVFPAFSLILDSLASGIGLPILERLRPAQGELGLQLWRHVLFITAVACGYLLFRGGHRPEYRPKFGSFGAFGGAEKPVVCFLFFATIVSIFVLWFLSARVDTYVDYYTRYDNLSWIGKRVVTICIAFKTGGTFVLLTILFRNYKRYRWYIWPFVVLRVVQEVLGSLGARIDAFMILLATAVLYHYCVRRISFRKALVATLVLGLVFTAIAVVRIAGADSLESGEAAFQGQAVPVGELMAVFVPGFHLYTERANGALPPVPWQLFFNDFISLIPLVDQAEWNPMYWYADNYFPAAAVPPTTIGPIALSALWGGEVSLFVEGFVNGILFALLMRWFARQGCKWPAMTVYVFCYSTCIMCLKYSIFWHLTPLVKIVLPVVLIVFVFREGVSGNAKLARVSSPA